MSKRYRANGVRLTLEQCKDPRTDGVALAECLSEVAYGSGSEEEMAEAICSNPNLNFDAISDGCFSTLKIRDCGEKLLGNAGWPLHFMMSGRVHKGLHRIWDSKAISRLTSIERISRGPAKERCEALAYMLTGRHLKFVGSDSFRQGDEDENLASWRATFYVFANACGAICMEEGLGLSGLDREDIEPNGPALAVCKAAGISFWPPEFDKYVGYSQNRRRRR